MSEPSPPAPADVLALVESLPSARKQQDALAVIEMLTAATGHPPRLTSATAMGFGHYDYAYESGRTGTSSLVAFAPRKANLVIYIMPGFAAYADQLARLGKHKLGKSCLYINKLADVDIDVLREIVVDSVRVMRDRYPSAD